MSTRVAMLVIAILVASSCASSSSPEQASVSSSPEQAAVDPVDAETTDPTPAPTAAITAAPNEVSWPDDFEWTTAELTQGVGDLQVWGSSLVGTAEQSFNAPSDLAGLAGDREGCVGFVAGRTGEVVWSPDGVTWEALASQPLWYSDGPITVEEWGERVAADEAPTDLRPVRLLVHEDQLFAVSYRDDGRRDDRISQLLPAVGAVNVEVWDGSSNTWEPVPGTDGVVRSGEVSAAAGPAGLVVLANSIDGEPLLWTLTGGEMVPADDPTLDRLPFPDSEDLDTDAGLAGLVRSIDLQATTEGFVGLFVLGGGETVMLRSDDGREWTELADAPTSGLLGLAAHAGMVVASTFSSEEVWRSDDDGRTWGLDDSLVGEAVMDIGAGAAGWALWTVEAPGWSPAKAVFYSADGQRWEPIRDLSADDVDRVTGLTVTDHAVMVITEYSPGGGWECPDVEPTTYQVLVATPTG